MIVNTTKIINGKEYKYTYSDTGYKIKRQDGAIYYDAIDPIDTDRTYEETDELIPVKEETDVSILQAQIAALQAQLNQMK